MDRMKSLLERREDLRSGDRDASAWAKSQGIFYAFNEKGDLLAAGTERLSLTEDGKLISEKYSDRAKEKGLSEEKQERWVLYFIPRRLTLKEYVSNSYLICTEIPLPLEFQVKELVCRDEIFTISPESGLDAVVGAFEVMQIAVGMLETLYLNHGVPDHIINQCYYYYLAEDHRDYLEKEKKKRKRKKASPSGAGQLLAAADFIQDDTGAYSCEYTEHIWGNEVSVIASYEGKSEQMDQALAEFATQLYRHIRWIEEHKDMIQKAILDDDMVELANDWMEGSMVEKDGKTCYELEDGELIPCPITQQMFLDSLELGGFQALCSDEFSQKIRFDMFFDTDPDFFACHCIEVFLTAASDGTYKIKVNGLAG